MTRIASTWISISLVTVASVAFADDKIVCSEAYQQAQKLQEESAWVEARDKLNVCARSVCTKFVRDECAAWLEQVKPKIPTVIFVAVTEKGETLSAVTVAAGDKVLGTADGKPIELDPGSYRFVFTQKDGRSVIVERVVVTGKKDTLIQATFLSPPTPPATLPAEQSKAIEPAPPPADRGSPLRTWGLVAGGAGVVLAGVGAALYFPNLSKFHEVQDRGATTDELSPYRTRIAWGGGLAIGGALLLGTGVVLLVAAPSKGSVSVSVTPRAITLGLIF